jgi:hypothetical protein
MEAGPSGILENMVGSSGIDIIRSCSLVFMANSECWVCVFKHLSDESGVKWFAHAIADSMVLKANSDEKGRDVLGFTLYSTWGWFSLFKTN